VGRIYHFSADWRVTQLAEKTQFTKVRRWKFLVRVQGQEGWGTEVLQWGPAEKPR